MQNYRMVYAFLEENPFSVWVRQLWDGTLPRKDILRLQLESRLGEVAVWGGQYPHVSISDCQACSDPRSFERIVSPVVEMVECPTIRPTKLRVHRGSHLVVDISSPVLEYASRVIRASTSPLVSRSEISDEEWQLVECRVSKTQDQKDLEIIKIARKIYEKSGCPPLDSGRYFRLGMLVSLTKRKINKIPDAATASENLQHFLVSGGEPPWYGQETSLHATIASGLNPRIDTIEKFSQLWDEIKHRFEEIELDNLCIMGQDPDRIVKARFWDSISQNFIEEERQGFKVIKKVKFASSNKAEVTDSAIKRRPI
jgi:hypothetical protein